MSKYGRNPFDTSVRALGLFERLKKDVEEETDDILHSLPQFMRIALIERQAGWYIEVNRYDLLVPFFVHESFPSLNPIGIDVRACTTIKPIKTGKKIVSENEFRESIIVELEDDSFTVQDFVLAIAYHGTFHLKPKAEKAHLKQLYEEFIQKNPQKAFQMAIEVGTCLIQSFEEVYKKFIGDNNAYSQIYDRQPMFLIDDRGEPAAHFSNAYFQLPIRAQRRSGIRICLHIQLEQTSSHGFIFSFGHRKNDKIMLSCEHVPTFILVKAVESRPTGVNQIVKLPITESMRREPFKLEVALYERGQLVVATNETLSKYTKISRRFSIYDGKLMVGSDLDGKKRGSFLEYAYTVEAINKRYRLSSVFKGGMMKIGNFPLADLPPNALNRPAIVRAIN